MVAFLVLLLLIDILIRTGVCVSSHIQEQMVFYSADQSLCVFMRSQTCAGTECAFLLA